MDDFNYRRRKASVVEIGDTPLGGDYPIRIQSMTNTNTLDTDASVAQCKRIADAGADYVRLTAQGVREAENIGVIRSRLRADGYKQPLVADIHFNPKAAFAAAAVTDKVRINPGNFVDAARTFKKLSYTDEEYRQEIKKINEALVPFLKICREHHTAIRLGVNHGSLSDRIMSRYGDTPAGMVESCMEFLRVCRDEDFRNVVISVKASNTVVMVETVRRMIAAMDKEGMHFPLHLGVTEAGDGEDGRIKSAVGIGTLLAEGIGDTVRVSLSEEPEAEVPVARKLVDYITARAGHAPISGCYSKGYDYFAPKRRATLPVGNIGGSNVPVVVTSVDAAAFAAEELKPDYYFGQNGEPHWLRVDASENPSEVATRLKGDENTVLLLSSTHQNPVGEMQAFIHGLTDCGCRVPVVALLRYDDTSLEDVQLKAAADFGLLLLDGLIDGVFLDAPHLEKPADAVRCAFGILQAARRRTTKTEFISCPSCGRTLFNLQETVREIKAATSHLKGLKIGIMGCIVNGPGEMADADYGYVGAGPGKVSLYKGKTCVEHNIPQAEALPRLIALIKENGDWVEPGKPELLKGVRNLLFDLGGVIMDLRRENCVAALEKLGMKDADHMLGLYGQTGVFAELEEGKATPEEFRAALRKQMMPGVTDKQIDDAFNAFLIGIPVERLRALEELHKHYAIYMLSNTNPIMFTGKIPEEFRKDGKNLEYYFDGVCTSYEEGCCKPDPRIFHNLLKKFGIRAEETLFFDDSRKNVEVAESLGFKGWVVEPGTEFMEAFNG